MTELTTAVAGGLLIAIAMVLVVVLRPGLVDSTAGKVFAFFALFLLPAGMLLGGLEHHMEASKTTEFCLSCHVMEDYGKSLLIDDSFYLPAVHYQNKYVPREEACFTCHTQYAMYGDYKAKLSGVKHLLVNYLGTIPDPIELYAPYQNRECLHCHGGARYFDEGDLHADMLEELRSNELSCLECHELAHEVDELESLELWEGDVP